jgi:hypothetical protein
VARGWFAHHGACGRTDVRTDHTYRPLCDHQARQPANSRRRVSPRCSGGGIGRRGGLVATRPVLVTVMAASTGKRPSAPATAVRARTAARGPRVVPAVSARHADPSNWGGRLLVVSARGCSRSGVRADAVRRRPFEASCCAFRPRGRARIAL